ncbi:hypothetical protein AKJ09_01478 [Labilithrix luteola]|uniref:Tryptophan synthase alpha chain n=1 Tax=Labilithrix luteola TaxID=1391654 RepID=A0A0K1PNW9_9BACT|nr:hypothetical protein [Labilithrix luteola]AKU94814.1 hypothetical protein AKJ09_01478 [Labilithrix luteola]
MQVVLAACLLVAAACAVDQTDLGGDPSVATPSFTPADGGDADVEERGLTNYCPSSECPAGHATCPGSRFACDVNFKVDVNNCGGCGLVCPQDTYRETYDCVDGRCQMACRTAPLTLDCDGVDDNGCETDSATGDNCAACGDKCPDDNACVDRTGFGVMKCGCEAGKIYCPYTHFPPCTDATADDNNCGACGNVCDPTGGGGVDIPSHMYVGCWESKCDTLKCDGYFGDCDGRRDNGCEVSLFDDNNCGACGNACAPTEKCLPGEFGQPLCLCPPGQTYCSRGCLFGSCSGKCADLSSDLTNCGACGIACSTSNDEASFAVCAYGSCERHCIAGTADCNGNLSDSCETNTDSDPRNCGACGHVCDAIAGQACVNGRCVVEPCDQDSGVVAR